VTDSAPERRSAERRSAEPRTVVITGASDGIGAAAARRLATSGHRVVVVGRSPAKTAAVAGSVGAAHLVVDFTRLDEVRGLAAELLSRYPTIDVLANNAGGIFGDPARTVDGFEQTLQVNHLAPFLLTRLLMDTLLASRATVINTASLAARMSRGVDVDTRHARARIPALRAYGDSKLATILFTRELHRRFHAQGLSTAAFHPGIVMTNFGSGSTSAMRHLYRAPMRRLVLISPERGAETLVWLTEGTPGQDWESGRFYVRKQVARTNPLATDDALALRLWERSAELLGLPDR
jgi:NAD(P)-dependent dehydrogenase (short-subunit alcohol dehydrogenase family)